jgi:hypothetical protein
MTPLGAYPYPAGTAATSNGYLPPQPDSQPPSWVGLAC